MHLNNNTNAMCKIMNNRPVRQGLLYQVQVRQDLWYQIQNSHIKILNKTINQIVKASEKACQNHLQHLIMLTPDSHLQVNVSTNVVNAVHGDKELSSKVETVLRQ